MKIFYGVKHIERYTKNNPIMPCRCHGRCRHLSVMIISAELVTGGLNSKLIISVNDTQTFLDIFSSKIVPRFEGQLSHLSAATVLESVKVGSDGANWTSVEKGL